MKSGALAFAVLSGFGLAAGCGGSSGSAGSGGASGSGGRLGSGGISASGGASASGGHLGSGGDSAGGGASATGGASGSGGQLGSGGKASGGTMGGSGGALGTAGTIGSGGVLASGGAKGGVGGSGAGTPGWVCPAASTFTGSPLPNATVAATRIVDAPPADAFNNMGNDFTNIEGALWLGDALYVSEMTNAFTIPPTRMLKITADDVVSEAIPSSGSNGLAVDGGGNIVSANHGAQGLVRFSLPSLAPTTLVSMYDGKPFNSPNDLAVASDGTIYFTDPDYQNRAMPQGATRVYQLRAGASTATSVTDYTVEPNGVSLSLDEQTLIVGGGSGVKKYAITNGTVAMTGTPFGPPEVTSSGVNTDGMAFDCAGNLYVAVASSTNVIVVKPDGTKAGTITTPGAQAVTNAAFGGADHQTLYLTAQGSRKTQGVFKTHLNFPGKPY